MQLDDVTLGILYHFVALYQIRVAQTHLAAGAQTEIFLRRVLHEVVAVDVDDLREGYLTRAGSLVLGVVDRLAHLYSSLLPVGYNDLQRVQNGHAALGYLVQVLSYAELHFGQIYDVVALGYADHFGERPNRGGRIALAAQCADSRHARVVPTHYGALLDQFQKVALRHHRVCQIQARELVLVRGIYGERLDEPVVERTVYVELQRTDRVRDALDRVALAVSIVIHGVDAPLVARAVVFGMDYTVHDRVAEEHVGVRHVYLGAQHLLAVGELAATHALEQIEILLHRPIAPWRRCARLRDRSSRQTYLLLRLVVDVSQPFLYKLDGPLVQLVEVIRGITLLGPLESQPRYVALYRVDILRVLLDGVGVVETQVALAAVFLGKTEVYADALGMTYVKIAVGLGRESRLYAAVAFCDRLFDDLFKEIERLFSRLVRFNSHIMILILIFENRINRLKIRQKIVWLYLPARYF